MTKFKYAGKQEYSSRTLGATWGIISAVMLPIVIVLICIGWRILKRKKAEEKEDEEFYKIKHTPLDAEESMKIHSDEDESIPYKKDVTEDSPEPTEGVKVIDNENDVLVTDEPYPSYVDNYNQNLSQLQQNPQTSSTNRPWSGETEIN